MNSLPSPISGSNGDAPPSRSQPEDDAPSSCAKPQLPAVGGGRPSGCEWSAAPSIRARLGGGGSPGNGSTPPIGAPLMAPTAAPTAAPTLSCIGAPGGVLLAPPANVAAPVAWPVNGRDAPVPTASTPVPPPPPSFGHAVDGLGGDTAHDDSEDGREPPSADGAADARPVPLATARGLSSAKGGCGLSAVWAAARGSAARGGSSDALAARCAARDEDTARDGVEADSLAWQPHAVPPRDFDGTAAPAASSWPATLPASPHAASRTSGASAGGEPRGLDELLEAARSCSHLPTCAALVPRGVWACTAGAPATGAGAPLAARDARRAPEASCWPAC